MHHTHHHIPYMWAWTGTFIVGVCTVRSLVCTCCGTTSQLNIGPFPPQTNLPTLLYMEKLPKLPNSKLLCGEQRVGTHSSPLRDHLKFDKMTVPVLIHITGVFSCPCEVRVPHSSP